MFLMHELNVFCTQHIQYIYLSIVCQHLYWMETLTSNVDDIQLVDFFDDLMKWVNIFKRPSLFSYKKSLEPKKPSPSLGYKGVVSLRTNISLHKNGTMD